MPMTLRWTGATALPVESDHLRPEALAPLSAADAARLPATVGNARAALGDLFRIEGDGSDQQLVLEGDLQHVRAIGAGMASGHLTVRGDVGSRLGAGMAGGTLVLEGDASDYAGAAMRGGLLRIRGRAGDRLGAAFPGARLGMRDGVIVVEGDAGDDVGLAMRRGLIAIGGRAGDLVGRGLVAGTIAVGGGCGLRPGSGMKRGSLILFGPVEGGFPPGFAPAGRYRPPAIALYLRHLRTLGLDLTEPASATLPERYNGDRIEGGQGEILAWT